MNKYQVTVNNYPLNNEPSKWFYEITNLHDGKLVARSATIYNFKNEAEFAGKYLIITFFSL